MLQISHKYQFYILRIFYLNIDTPSVTATPEGLYCMSMSLPILFLPMPASTAAPAVTENPGAELDGKGNDFLDPDTIQNTTDQFTGKISPVTSNTLTNQIAPTDPFGKNPDANDILKNTDALLNGTFSSTNPIIFPVPLVPYPFIQPVPDLGMNPDPTRIVLSSTFFSNGVSPPGNFHDPFNLQPLLWKNPGADEILLGSLGAQNNLLTGRPILSPPVNPRDEFLFNLWRGSGSPWIPAPTLPPLAPAFQNFNVFPPPPGGNPFTLSGRGGFSLLW